jgi:5-formyltetrahydrofolate cyclo-ligase
MCEEKNIFDAKAALRKMMNIRRNALPEKRRAEMSEAIAERVAVLPETSGARNVHLYLSIPQSSEVSTVPLIERLHAMGKPLSVPVVRDDALISSLYRKGDALRTASFGQPEPVEVLPVEDEKIDIVLMPLLAFDGNGYRIGYGKGFYDRFLGNLSKRGIFPLRIGLAFSAQMVERVPVNSWDETLDSIVHECGTLRFG